MRHSSNKLYILVTALLFTGGIIGGEAVTRLSSRSPERAGGSVLGKRAAFAEATAAKGREQKSDEAPPSPIQKGDSKNQTAAVFFDRSFLRIEGSVVMQKAREIGQQTKVTVARAVEPPRNVGVTDIKNGALVTITWDPFPSPPRAVLIFRSDDKGEQASIGEVPGDSGGYHDTMIALGLSYSYTLQSVSKDGEKSEMVGPFPVGPIEDRVPPPPPSGVVHTLTDDGVTFAWADPDVPDLARVSIYRSSVEGVVGEKIQEVQPGVQKYTDQEAEDGKTYYYFLKSEDKNGNESVNELVHNRLGNPAIFTPVF